jgi:hypothetical protein
MRGETRIGMDDLLPLALTKHTNGATTYDVAHVAGLVLDREALGLVHHGQ